jgi:hypothetical protein
MVFIDLFFPCLCVCGGECFSPILDSLDLGEGWAAGSEILPQEF